MRIARGSGFGKATAFAAARKCITVHTNPSAATSPCTKGTASKSAGGGTPGRPSCVEGIPLIAAATRPAVVLAGRLAAQWAPDAGRSRFASLLIVFKFAVWSDDRIVNDRTHARCYDLRPDYLGSVGRFTEPLAQHQPYRAATYSALSFLGRKTTPFREWI